MYEASVALWAALCAPACAAYATSAAARACQQQNIRADIRVLIACAAASAVIVAGASSTAEALALIVFSSALSYLTVYDLNTLSVPVAPVFAFAALGVLEGALRGEAFERVLAAAGGFAAFFTLNLVYRRLRGKEGLGAGDAFVAAMLGAWLSFEGLAWSVALGGAAGLAWAIATRRRSQEPTPFVPALAAGAALTLIAQGAGG